MLYLKNGALNNILNNISKKKINNNYNTNIISNASLLTSVAEFKDAKTTVIQTTISTTSSRNHSINNCTSTPNLFTVEKTLLLMKL